MPRFLLVARFSLVALAVVSVILPGRTLSGQASRTSTSTAAPPSPPLAFHLDDNFFKIPPDIWPSEAVGVALNKAGHIFLLNRGNHPLLEFNPDGSFVQSIGEGSTIFHAAHSVRFDRDDNMWIVDSGNNVVVKFTPERRIVQALGRRLEPWVFLTHGIERAIPGPANFYQPTDTAVGADGSTYVTDGYGNSRVVKFSREGNLVKYWGDRGSRPGQFNTPHSIVIDRNENLYVADRANNRIQVFDTDGTFKQEWPLEGPPWSLCITPGATQTIFVGSVGKVYKVDLSGKVAGSLGKLGRLPGWFDSIHAIACPDDRTLFLANEFSYRFDRVVLED